MTAVQPIVYQPARRANVGVLVMLSGPSGSGKTMSALRLARGLAGPGGLICFADTENDRALYYALTEEDIAAGQTEDGSRFDFKHARISEPFRPRKFEDAAVAAQKQGAVVWICDSFSHEHVGPGGVLDFHEEELSRMVAGILKRNQNANEWEVRERMKAAAWIAPKGEHKHMLQRLYQLNMHVILCCQAEKKLALETVKEGKRRGKVDFVDKGFQPVCGSDIPYAMTMSFMLAVEKPGYPIVIKPLLPQLQPLIPLDRPIDEATGERIAAWARGGTVSGEPKMSQPMREANRVNQGTTPETPPETPPDIPGEAPPSPNTASEAGEPPPDIPPGDDDFPGDRPSEDGPPEAEVTAFVQDLVRRFNDVRERRQHTVLTDDADVRRRIEWLRTNRPPLFDEVNRAIRASFERTKRKQGEQAGMAV